MIITLKYPNLNILNYFEQVVDWLNLEEELDNINSAYTAAREAFVHLDIACPVCDPATGEKCDHPGGIIICIRILPNDFVIRSGVHYALIMPDEEIFETGESQEAYNSIPVRVREMIEKDGFVRLSNRTLVVVDSLVDKIFVEEEIFRRIAEMQGFKDEEGECYYPQVILD